MKMQAVSSHHNSCEAWVGFVFFNACSWLTRGVWGMCACVGGGNHLGGKKGGACGSCKMPTGSHYTWVLSGSFRTPKNFLPLNGAFGKRGVHWNHKETQEESENQRGRGWKREEWMGWGRKNTTGGKEQQLRKRKFKARTMNHRVIIYNMAECVEKSQRERKSKLVWCSKNIILNTGNIAWYS